MGVYQSIWDKSGGILFLKIRPITNYAFVNNFLKISSFLVIYLKLGPIRALSDYRVGKSRSGKTSAVACGGRGGAQPRGFNAKWFYRNLNSLFTLVDNLLL